MLKMCRRMAAQFEEEPPDSEMGPERAHRRGAADEQIRQKGDHRRQAGSDQIAPVFEPAAVRRLRYHMAGTGALGRRPQARFRLRSQRRRLKLVQRARQLCREAAGKQRPCLVGVRAIPARNAGIPPTRLAPIGAVADKTTAAPGVLGTAIKLCLSPGLCGNVVLAGQRQIPKQLHRRLPARRSSRSARATPSQTFHKAGFGPRQREGGSRLPGTQSSSRRR